MEQSTESLSQANNYLGFQTRLLSSDLINSEQRYLAAQTSNFVFPKIAEGVVKDSVPEINGFAGGPLISEGFGSKGRVHEGDDSLVPQFYYSLGVEAGKIAIAKCTPACVSYDTPVDGIVPEATPGGSSGESAKVARELTARTTKVVHLNDLRTRTSIGLKILDDRNKAKIKLVSCSDGGGSTRVPAACNSIVGLMPETGELPIPVEVGDWDGSARIGFYAQSLDILAGAYKKFRNFKWQDPDFWAYPELRGRSRTSYSTYLNQPLPAQRLLYLNGIWNRSDNRDAYGDSVDLNSEALHASMDRMKKLGHIVVDKTSELLFEEPDILEGVFGYFVQVSVATMQDLDKKIADNLITYDDFDNACKLTYVVGKIFESDVDKYSEAKSKFVQKYLKLVEGYDFVVNPTLSVGFPFRKYYKTSGELASILWQLKDDPEELAKIKDGLMTDESRRNIVPEINDIAISNISWLSSISVPIKEVTTEKYGDLYNPSLCFHSTSRGMTPNAIGIARAHGHQ